ncbi:hypothetical protein FNF27_02524 [Cafeteria roenbergensis]|uniref:DUF4200 domain-containing protein n=3 Tax=Cafeteria roenbergensis TaxID=33653 RepID=A0A5A8CF79_CAFRO|nr:hypothetical protein FNF29_04352 [Cafeteria roenbergensis]KAA0158622.1 hypothetical protein FNF28_06149 [Cafeteria roenbergensis]KAA0167385.1 hypothetical protein FNF31_00826 [Cafeteria roenbergensis]KAA0176135.1 hypothetical protein FNF27_02524 [Cafeteria roenbergensis]|eukprot:KAA0151666.1 hypothetical protein FNF29_04352 [Cafeteria roenbergensis]
MTKRQIRAIVNKDEEGGVSGGALLAGLESNVKGVLAERRREHDLLKQEVEGLKRQREALTLRLRDLQVDGEALGFADTEDRGERLKPVESITRKPVFAAGTDLRELVSVHAQEAEEREAVITAGQRYVYMHERLGRELVALRRRLSDLEDAQAEEASLKRELAKRIITAQEALGNTRARLSKLRRSVREEKALWMGEIADQQAFLDSKAGFETFLEKQLERHQQLEQEAERRRAARREEKIKTKMAVGLIAQSGFASKLQANLEGAKTAEAEFDEAFKQLGAAVLSRPAAPAKAQDRAATRSAITASTGSAEVVPQEVVRVAREELQVWESLVQKLTDEEARVAQLTAKLAEARAALEAPEAAVPAPRAHRELAEREAELQAALKRADAEKTRLEFARESVEPVRLGLQVMAERLLGVHASLDAAGSTRRVLQALRGKVAVLMDECRRMRAKDADAEEDGASRPPTPPDGPGEGVSLRAGAPASPVSTGGGARAGASNSTAAALVQAMEAGADLGLSEHNVRVQPRSGEARARGRRRAAAAVAKAEPRQAGLAPALTVASKLPPTRVRRTGLSAAAAEAQALSQQLELWAGDWEADGRPPRVGRIPTLRAQLPSIKDARLDEAEALAEAGGDTAVAASSRQSLLEEAQAARVLSMRGASGRAGGGASGRRGSAAARRVGGSAPTLPAVVALHPVDMRHSGKSQPRLASRAEVLARSSGRLPLAAEGKDGGSTSRRQPRGAGPAVSACVEGGWEADDDADEVWDRSEVKKIARNVLAAGRRRERELAQDD